MPASDSTPDSHASTDSADARERSCSISEVSAGKTIERDDSVVIEEPMEIRIVYGPDDERVMRSLSITMRTPGNDQELAAGFLLTEGIVSHPEEIEGTKSLGTDEDGGHTGNIVRVDLRADVDIDVGRLQRNFFTTSSCGVCGKASLEALVVQGLRPLPEFAASPDKSPVARSVVHGLSAALRERQPTFSRTGGLHAAAIFSHDGQIEQVREDVGRHNAVDKLIGRCFLDGKNPLSQYIMMISGRASFEIMQKAIAAGVPVVVAVGAPSSLAVDTARHYNMTLIGFASAERFNIYAGPERIEND